MKKYVSDNFRGLKYNAGFPIPFAAILSEHNLKQAVDQKPAYVSEKEYLLGKEVPSVSDKYMERQTLGKGLPEFNGNTTSCVLFIRVFRQTTEACGFTVTENMLRHQKCLKVEALEPVRAVLTTTNVDKVISILQRRFVRADCIIEDLMNKVSGHTDVRDD